VRTHGRWLTECTSPPRTPKDTLSSADSADGEADTEEEEEEDREVATSAPEPSSVPEVTSESTKYSELRVEPSEEFSWCSRARC
jgi:hypothetical protein